MAQEGIVPRFPMPNGSLCPSPADFGEEPLVGSDRPS